MPHTPGPWMFRKTDRAGMEPRYDILHGIHYVADPMTSSSYRPAEETCANAHLIAAAPELLAALEMMVSAVGDPDILDVIHEVALPAIKKAKGG